MSNGFFWEKGTEPSEEFYSKQIKKGQIMRGIPQELQNENSEYVLEKAKT